MGPSQCCMKSGMAIDMVGPGSGTVLGIKEKRGSGTTLDVVPYDGTARTGGTIVVGGTNSPIVTEIRVLLQPRPDIEVRIEKRFDKIEEVRTAAGVKIVTPDLEGAMAGAPVRVIGNRGPDEVAHEAEAELTDIEITIEEEGVVIKVDALGSLKAMVSAL